MKKLLLILLCLPMIGFGQAPQGLNYQAIARDSTGASLINDTLILQFSIISDSITGNISWQETHSVTTNDFGLFTTVIGEGTSTSVGSSATFDEIDWGSASHFLNVQIDGLDMGTTQFMSVPYALYAKTSGSGEVIPYQAYNLFAFSSNTAPLLANTAYFFRFYAPSSGDYTNFTFFGGGHGLSATPPDTFSGTVGVAIYENIPGNPDRPLGIIAQGEHTYVLESIWGYQTISFNSPATLEANKEYWAVIGSDPIANSAFYCRNINSSTHGVITGLTTAADSLFNSGVGFTPITPATLFFTIPPTTSSWPFTFWFRIY